MKNCRPHGTGYQLYTRIKGRFHQEHREEQPTPREIRTWLENTRGAARIAPHLLPSALQPRFQDDVKDYLASVASMTSYADRQLHMKEWAKEFQGRERNSITAIDIRRVLERKRREYEPGTCNRRRTALMHFYTVLNGKSGYNPVRDVPPYREEATIRAQPIGVCLRILACMPASKTRARLRVMLWTGWPHTQIKKLKPEHLDLRHTSAYVTSRQKGKGRKGHELPLLPCAIAALKEFAAWDCWGTFSNGSVYRSFQSAVRRLNARRQAVGLPPVPTEIRPYDLRHTFGTFIACRLTDERAIQELMLHSRAEQTRRYTERATADRLRRAVATLATVPSSLVPSVDATGKRKTAKTLSKR